jgi:hypothetical protein
MERIGVKLIDSEAGNTMLTLSTDLGVSEAGSELLSGVFHFLF